MDTPTRSLDQTEAFRIVAWGRRVRKRTLLLIVSGGVLFADQVTKLMVTASVPPGFRVPLLGDFFAVHHLTNTGGAMGFQSGRPMLVVGLAVVSLSLLLLLYWFLPIGRPNRLLATTLAIGGGVGNLIDRIRVDGVVDFLEITIGNTVLPVFNFADVAVMIGAIWLAWTIWWDERVAMSDSG